MNLQLAGGGVGTATPRVQRHAEAFDDGALSIALAVRMPVVLPADQLGTDFHFAAIDIGRLSGADIVQVLVEDVVAVGTHLGGQVIVGGLRQQNWPADDWELATLALDPR